MQPLQEFRSTFGTPSTSDIAPKGQVFTQVPKPMHPSEQAMGPPRSLRRIDSPSCPQTHIYALPDFAATAHESDHFLDVLGFNA
jgi:hypothetical protein